MHVAPSRSDGPYVSEAVACELLRTSQTGLSRLIEAGQLQAKTVDDKRSVRSVDIVSYLRRAKSREVQTRGGATATWFDDSGREINAEEENTWSRTGALIQMMGARSSVSFCTLCPLGHGTPCDECPAPVDPPEPGHEREPKRSRIGRLLASSKGKNNV